MLPSHALTPPPTTVPVSPPCVLHVTTQSSLHGNQLAALTKSYEAVQKQVAAVQLGLKEQKKLPEMDQVGGGLRRGGGGLKERKKLPEMDQVRGDEGGGGG